MKETHKLCVAFCRNSWKPFNNESDAMDFIKEMECIGELWSITPATIEFNTPYLKHEVEVANILCDTFDLLNDYKD